MLSASMRPYRKGHKSVFRRVIKAWGLCSWTRRDWLKHQSLAIWLNALKLMDESPSMVIFIRPEPCASWRKLNDDRQHTVKTDNGERLHYVSLAAGKILLDSSNPFSVTNRSLRVNFGVRWCWCCSGKLGNLIGPRVPRWSTFGLSTEQGSSRSSTS